MKRLLAFSLIASGLIFGGAACLSGSSDEGNVDFVPGKPNFDTTICAPMGTPQSNLPDGGLLGSLHYYETQPAAPLYANVRTFIDNAIFADVSLFFADLFIPTRPFDRGFQTITGDIITVPPTPDNPTGTMYEWFGVHMESDLVLASNEAPGDYQLAILADDGAVMKRRDDNSDVVNIDGVHPTRMGCSASPVTMTATGRFPVSVDYYQGPKYHIALVVMWRPNPANGALDPRCNQANNNNALFFDYTQNPPTAQPAFNELLSRGWKVLTPDNYRMPQGLNNPCQNIPAPVISNFNLSTPTSTSVSATWLTDIISTSQLEVTQVSTGAVITTTLDSNLVTNHSQTVTGLIPNTLYRIQAKSRSSSNNEGVSNIRGFRTAP